MLRARTIHAGITLQIFPPPHHPPKPALITRPAVLFLPSWRVTLHELPTLETIYPEALISAEAWIMGLYYF